MEYLQIYISNNGNSFNLEEGLAKNGLGLKNIIYRIDALNGTIEIKNLKNSDTEYNIKIPIS